METKVKMTFDPKIAKELGTDAAIIYSNIDFWVDTNKLNKINFKDGRYWMFNSVSAFVKQFTWLTESQIKTALLKLESSGLLIVGNYNNKGYDRTKWYSTYTDLLIGEKSQMDCSEIENGLDENRQPIPDNKQDIKNIYKSKMSDISVSDDYSKLCLKTKKEKIDISCTRAEGYAFFIADQFRHLFIKNIEEKGGIANDQINAKFHAYVNPILLIHKKGGYNSDHLREIYQFLDSDSGEFWKANILSTSTLRKQMQKLILAKNSKHNQIKAPERN